MLCAIMENNRQLGDGLYSCICMLETCFFCNFKQIVTTHYPSWAWATRQASRLTPPWFDEDWLLLFSVTSAWVYDDRFVWIDLTYLSSHHVILVTMCKILEHGEDSLGTHRSSVMMISADCQKPLEKTSCIDVTAPKMTIWRSPWFPIEYTIC